MRPFARALVEGEGRPERQGDREGTAESRSALPFILVLVIDFIALAILILFRGRVGSWLPILIYVTLVVVVVVSFIGLFYSLWSNWKIQRGPLRLPYHIVNPPRRVR
jgi:membrane protein YdbS with pleckstrin-like domain